MIKYNFYGQELLLSKLQYADGHTCILISDIDGNAIDRLTTNFDKNECKKAFRRDLKETEFLICMTPSYEHPIVRDLALDMSENGLIMCWYDFIRTYNEYYRYSVSNETMAMLESKDIIEFTCDYEEYDYDFDYEKEM